MAKRFTDTDMWDKEWFMLLSPKMKCFVKYVRDKANLAGIWHPNYHLASTYISEPVNESELLTIDEGRQFLKLDCGKIFCIGFISFQYGDHLNDKSPVHKKIIGILQKHIYKNNTLFDTLFNRVLDTDKEEEEDKEEEKEEVKEKETPKLKVVKPQLSLTNPFSETFLDHWNIWKNYKKKEFRFFFKSIESEQAAINELVGLSEGIEQTAIEIINQSMAKGWKGLFTIKENEQSNSKTKQPGGSKITGSQLNEALTKFRNQGKHTANAG